MPACLPLPPPPLSDVCEQLLELYEQCRPATSNTTTSSPAPSDITSSDARAKQSPTAPRASSGSAAAVAVAAKGGVPSPRKAPAPASPLKALGINVSARAATIPTGAAASAAPAVSPHKEGAKDAPPKPSASPLLRLKGGPTDVTSLIEGKQGGVSVGGSVEASPQYTPGKSPLGAVPSHASEGRRRGAHASPSGGKGSPLARPGGPSPHAASPVEPVLDRAGLATGQAVSPAPASAREGSPLPERREGRQEDRGRVEGGKWRGERRGNDARGTEGGLARWETVGGKPVDASGERGERKEIDDTEGEADVMRGKETAGAGGEGDDSRSTGVRGRQVSSEVPGRGKAGIGDGEPVALTKGVSFKQWERDEGGEVEEDGEGRDAAKLVRLGVAKGEDRGEGHSAGLAATSTVATVEAEGKGRVTELATVEGKGKREEVEEGEDVVAEQALLGRVDAGVEAPGTAASQQQQLLRQQGGEDENMKEDMEIDSEAELAAHGAAKHGAQTDVKEGSVHGLEGGRGKAAGSGILGAKPAVSTKSGHGYVGDVKHGEQGDAGAAAAGRSDVPGGTDGDQVGSDKLLKTATAAAPTFEGTAAHSNAADEGIMKVAATPLTRADEEREDNVPTRGAEGEQAGTVGERVRRDESRERKESDGSYERKRSEERDGRYGGRRDWERGRDRHGDRDDDRDRYGDRDRDRYGDRDRDGHRSHDKDRDDRDRGYGRDRDRYRDRDRDRGYKRDYDDWDARDRRDYRDGRDGRDGVKRRPRDDNDYDERTYKKGRG